MLKIDEIAARYVVSGRPSSQEDNILEDLDSFLVGICKKCLQGNTPTEDQLQNARISALDVLRKFRPEVTRFSVAVYYAIKKVLHSNRDEVIRIPQRARNSENLPTTVTLTDSASCTQIYTDQEADITRADITTALSKLTEVERTVVNATMQGYTQAEIADRIGCSKSFVGKIKQKTFSKLRELLKEYE